MSKKQKLTDILTKLKSWSESSGDATLNDHLKELEDEINAADEETDEEGGNSPDTPPDLP